MTGQKTGNDVREHVRARYGKIASQGGSCCGPSSGCGGAGDADQLAKSIGYSEAALKELPEGANLGLSCGNPVAIAGLKAGEVVLDLGSGAGFDVFQAGRAVGATGRVIGVDMTPEMIAKARANVQAYRERSGLGNVEFRLGEIEHLPVEDGSVDVVLSNCVINLSPHKPQVWREIARVLKPGGRVSVSDMALLRPLPPAIANQVEAWSGCIAGAVTVAEYEDTVRKAGFENPRLTPKNGYVSALAKSDDPILKQAVDLLPEGASAEEYLVSLNIEAVKPPRR